MPLRNSGVQSEGVGGGVFPLALLDMVSKIPAGKDNPSAD